MVEIAKRDEIESAIANYERCLGQARADLSHINAVISILETTGDRDSTRSYTDIHRLFRRGEVITICKSALAEAGPMNTRDLVTRILTVKGLDTADRVLEKSVAKRLFSSLRMQARRGKICEGAKKHGVCVWRLM